MISHVLQRQHGFVEVAGHLSESEINKGGREEGRKEGRKEGRMDGC